MKLTPSMEKGLLIVRRDGVVFAGINVTKQGAAVNVSASTLRGLAARGFVTLSLSPDGGIMARLRVQS